MILSASVASSSRLVVSAVDAMTIQSSRRNELSVEAAFSPSSCCIRRRSWVVLRSPSSSALKSCCNRRCSEAVVRLISRGGRSQYEITDFSGNFRRERDDDMVELGFLHGYAPSLVNWASTCANHTSGSAGQYGGSLRWTAATAVVD